MLSARRALALSAALLCALALACSKKDASDKAVASSDKPAAAASGKVDCAALVAKLMTMMKESEQTKALLADAELQKMFETAFADGCKKAPPDPKDAECAMKAKDEKELQVCGDFLSKWAPAK
jgi:hypothetical protein